MNIFQRAETVESAVERLERLMWEKDQIEREIAEMNIIIDRLSDDKKKSFSVERRKKSSRGIVNNLKQ